jgi:hypothetical protein
MLEKRRKPRKKIGLQQVLLQDSSVFSIQWIVLPPAYIGQLTPNDLLTRYFHYIRMFTMSLIRPYQAHDTVEFRLLNTGISLISFTSHPPTSSENSETATLSISGGFLVQKDNCSRGELSFISKPVPSGLKIVLQLSNYCPMLLGTKPSRLRKIIYRITQAYIHKIVTVRFLAKTYYELEGVRPSIKVVKARIKKGETT